MATVFKPADRFANERENVWVEFMKLASETNPVNLGQGFPDFACPEHLTDALAAVAKSPNPLLHQYTRDFGHPRLINALSNLYSRLIEREINPKTEIIVTVGAYESLYCSFLGLVNPGDEVIIIEPFFDCYEPMVVQAGGVPVFIPLKPKISDGPISSKDWVLDPQELESKFSSKTKIIVINTPHNPIGKVFSLEEMEMIASLCKKYNCIALMDEVYEWIVYSGDKHIKMATLPGMWERTLTVGSAGKTFSATGWKLGWTVGPEHLIWPLQLAHQNSIYTCATPTQEAIAIAFEKEIERLHKPDSYWRELSAMLEKKRDKMANMLLNSNLIPTIPQGGYFMMANISDVVKHIDLSNETDPEKDYRFLKWLSKNFKLQGIPPSAFYSQNHKALGENYIRFCFIKKDETINKAGEILLDLKKSLD